MNDQAAFAKLADALAPWRSQLVFVGGWAYRLYRLHPKAEVPAYQPVATRDADVAFADREPLEGDIRAGLSAAGFKQQLTSDHRPPVSKYTLDEDDAGFYAEFLTPLTGSGFTRKGAQRATLGKAGVTAQRLRYLELLLRSPWSVVVDTPWGTASALELRVPNPVTFIVQKLLIHDDRTPVKKAQDLLYIHDTLLMFAPVLDELASLWRHEIRATLHEKWVRDLLRTKDILFGTMNDRMRDAARIPQDRDLDPERMRATCFAALGEMLE